MLRITCPHCGPRAQAEFAFDRALDAILPLGASPEEAVGRLYTRDNPKGWSWELWRHTAGCGVFLKLHRHTVTHEIAAVVELGGEA
jgi:sarcosine oxidase subunit delta